MNNKFPYVFIYIKKGRYLCLNEDQARASHDVYLSKGWRHSATIDAGLWLEAYLNRGETGRFELIEEISGLTIEKCRPPLCKCGRVCVYYGAVGGYSKKCKACNAHKAKLSRESRARSKNK